MVTVKIICACGQKYAFDVYPLNNRMPAPVQCPVCGQDGTAAANEIMARKLDPQPATPEPKPGSPLKLQPSASNGSRNVVSQDLVGRNAGSRNQELPDVVKDTWKWCQDFLAGWRDLRLPLPAGFSGSKLTAAEEIWRQRALAAERRAEEALAAARADLAPHLAQVLKEALVQELAVQRKELLQAQQIAATEMAQLMRHLDDLKVPLQERLRSYESRIQELEKELAARSEENRELLKLKIEMVRHQLELERSRNRMEFN